MALHLDVIRHDETPVVRPQGQGLLYDHSGAKLWETLKRLVSVVPPFARLSLATTMRIYDVFLPIYECGPPGYSVKGEISCTRVARTRELILAYKANANRLSISLSPRLRLKSSPTFVANGELAQWSATSVCSRIGRIE